MRIRRISVYQLDLPYVGGSYNWAKGKSVSVADSTVVRIDTDTHVHGVGEVCPLPVYLPAYPGGVRAGLAELGPQLIGLDPTRVGQPGPPDQRFMYVIRNRSLDSRDRRQSDR